MRRNREQHESKRDLHQSDGKKQDSHESVVRGQTPQQFSRLYAIKRACKSYLKRMPLGPKRAARVYHDEQTDIWICNYTIRNEISTYAQREGENSYVASVNSFSDGLSVWGETRADGQTAREAIAGLLRKLGRGSRSLKEQTKRDRREATRASKSIPSIQYRFMGNLEQIREGTYWTRYVYEKLRSHGLNIDYVGFGADSSELLDNVAWIQYCERQLPKKIGTKRSAELLPYIRNLDPPDLAVNPHLPSRVWVEVTTTPSQRPDAHTIPIDVKDANRHIGRSGEPAVYYEPGYIVLVIKDRDRYRNLNPNHEPRPRTYWARVDEKWASLEPDYKYKVSKYMYNVPFDESGNDWWVADDMNLTLLAAELRRLQV